MCDSRDAKKRFRSTNPDKKNSRGRDKKRPRRFLGATCDDEPANKIRPSSSARMIPAAKGTFEVRNRLNHINILFPALEELLICKQCHGQVKLGESEVQGLGFKIEVECIECGELADTSINSCRKFSVKNQAWENNRRTVVTFRAFGLGHAGLLTFCEKVAKDSMKTVVIEEKAVTETGLNVSGDGSWRKKGFSSLQGFASIVAPGYAAAEWANSADAQRIFHAKRQVQASTKETRTLRRRARELQEEDCYPAGAH